MFVHFFLSVWMKTTYTLILAKRPRSETTYFITVTATVMAGGTSMAGYAHLSRTPEIITISGSSASAVIVVYILMTFARCSLGVAVLLYTMHVVVSQ